MREYFQTRKDKHNEIMKKWRAKNKDKVATMCKKYNEKTNYSYFKAYQKENIDGMSEKYLISQIKKSFLVSHGIHIHTDDIPKHLIDLQRDRLIISRQIN